MPSGMSICQSVPPKFKPDKGPFRAAHCCYENREMMICHKWKRAEWFCRKADGKWNINCYLRVEVRSERFIPNVGASRVDKNLKWDLMDLWFLIYFRKSLKRPSFQLGTNGSKKWTCGKCSIVGRKEFICHKYFMTTPLFTDNKICQNA